VPVGAHQQFVLLVILVALSFGITLEMKKAIGLLVMIIVC
jgi:hypothetical protein